MNLRVIWFAVIVFSCAAAVPSFAVEAGDKAGQSSVAQQYWPQWRGPMETGVAPLGNPPTEWSEEKNVKWKIRVPGQGSATPIIWGNQVFVQTAIPTGRKPEGAETKEASPEPPQENDKKGGKGGKGMPRGEKPSEFYQFVLYCYDRATGKELWHKLCREECRTKESMLVREVSPLLRQLRTASTFTPSLARADCIASTWRAI